MASLPRRKTELKLEDFEGVGRVHPLKELIGKSLPDFSHTDEHEVVLSLDGEVQNENFLRFLEKIGKETRTTFTAEDFLVLDRVHREIPIPSTPAELKARLKHLIDLGIIKAIGRGSSIRYLLCQRYYAFSGKGGFYTRKIGLDKETNKELLLKHIPCK